MPPRRETFYETIKISSENNTAVLELFFFFRGEGLGFHKEYSLRFDLSLPDKEIFDFPRALKGQVSQISFLYFRVGEDGIFPSRGPGYPC